MRYLKQPSTWRGLALLVGSAVMYVDPQLIDLLLTLIAAFVGGLEIAKDEDKK